MNQKNDLGYGYTGLQYAINHDTYTLQCARKCEEQRKAKNGNFILVDGELIDISPSLQQIQIIKSTGEIIHVDF